MVALFPEGFEEVEREGSVELAAYTDAAGEERVWHVFGGARSKDVEDGWESRWRTFHRPLQVGGLWIGPPWEAAPRDGLTVVIDPGRAFGTGAHPTTQLCLGLLQELERGALLDVGCGSGVLSIAGRLLGYRPVVGVDVEAAAIDATRANALVNGVELEARLVEEDVQLPPADVVVANISLASVVATAERVQAGTYLTSGYLVSDRLSLDGWQHLERRTLDGWAADVHRRS